VGVTDKDEDFPVGGSDSSEDDEVVLTDCEWLFRLFFFLFLFMSFHSYIIYLLAAIFFSFFFLYYA
jgi:hypothetical protein